MKKSEVEKLAAKVEADWKSAVEYAKKQDPAFDPEYFTIGYLELDDFLYEYDLDDETEREVKRLLVARL